LADVAGESGAEGAGRTVADAFGDIGQRRAPLTQQMAGHRHAPVEQAQRSGVIVNVTSSVTLAPMPLVSIYTASKTAIQGFTGSLEHELKPFDVRVKLVEPGYGPGTRFTENTDVKLEDAIPKPYLPFARPILEAFGRPGGVVTTAQDVAETVWQAAHDRSDQLRWPAGPDAVALARSAAS